MQRNILALTLEERPSCWTMLEGQVGVFAAGQRPWSAAYILISAFGCLDSHAAHACPFT